MNREEKRRVLVVDDEPDNASIFTMSLEDGGFEVDTFTDSPSALSKYKDGGNYDLLILDIKMPYMNGFELYDEIRKIDDKVKVLFLTAFGEGFTEEFARRFRSSSSTSSSSSSSSSSSNVSIIRKPITVIDLVNKVNEVIV